MKKEEIDQSQEKKGRTQSRVVRYRRPVGGLPLVHLRLRASCRLESTSQSFPNDGLDSYRTNGGGSGRNKGRDKYDQNRGTKFSKN